MWSPAALSKVANNELRHEGVGESWIVCVYNIKCLRTEKRKRQVGILVIITIKTLDIIFS